MNGCPVALHGNVVSHSYFLFKILPPSKGASEDLRIKATQDEIL